MGGAYQFLWQDCGGYALASLLALILLLLPAMGLVAIAGRAGLVRDTSGDRWAWALIAASAALPALDALLLRAAGIGAPILLHLSLGAWGVSQWRDWHVPPRLLMAGAIWWLLVAWANVDVDTATGLYQPLLVLDTVKHAVVVRELAAHGTPFADPFFARAVPASYYYYFYIGPAIIKAASAGLADPRMAFAAASWVAGPTLPAMGWLLASRAKIIAGHHPRRFLGILLALCCVSGLDLLPSLAGWAFTGATPAQLDWWSDEVRWALTSVLWVPHHLTALIAIFAGTLLLGTRVSGQTAAIATIVGGALCFASAFGLSLWVTLGAVPILAVWWITDLSGQSGTLRWLLPAAALLAALLAAPQLHDVLANRSIATAPLAFWIRGPIPTPPADIADVLIRTVALLAIYPIEFGVFGLGVYAYARAGHLTRDWRDPVGRLLILAAVIGLIEASFLRSTVINNDFGWRVTWFVELPALIWTAAIASERWPSGLLWRVALTLGALATLWDIAGLRLIRPPLFHTKFGYINRDPALDLALRGAYRSLNAQLPAGATLQANPVAAERVFDFGLYGRHRVAVADRSAQLFGASLDAVRQRIGLLAPIYTSPLAIADVHRRAQAAGADFLLLTDRDPVWRQVGGLPAGWSCVWRAPHLCLLDARKAARQ